MGDASPSSTSSTTFAEVAEGVRAALAAYADALDDGRTDDVVATFCPDGAIEIPGLGAHEGNEALRTAFARWTPRRPQRHLVLNTHVTEWSGDEAVATSDGSDGPWRFHRRTAAFEGAP